MEVDVKLLDFIKLKKLVIIKKKRVKTANTIEATTVKLCTK